MQRLPVAILQCAADPGFIGGGNGTAVEVKNAGQYAHPALVSGGGLCRHVQIPLANWHEFQTRFREMASSCLSRGAQTITNVSGITPARTSGCCSAQPSRTIRSRKGFGKVK
jgi:hypothetical protein